MWGDVTAEQGRRLAVVEFGKFSPKHSLDLWLLDPTRRRWKHLPGMPAPIVPKATDVEWMADGRVVIVTGNVVGVWRPGTARLAVGRVKAPKQPGSEFVIW
jgi:hypothetical protein